MTIRSVHVLLDSGLDYSIHKDKRKVKRVYGTWFSIWVKQNQQSGTGTEHSVASSESAWNGQHPPHGYSPKTLHPVRATPFPTPTTRLPMYLLEGALPSAMYQSQDLITVTNIWKIIFKQKAFVWLTVSEVAAHGGCLPHSNQKKKDTEHRFLTSHQWPTNSH